MRCCWARHEIEQAEHLIDLAVRDIKIWMGGMLVVLFTTGRRAIIRSLRTRLPNLAVSLWRASPRLR